MPGCSTSSNLVVDHNRLTGSVRGRIRRGCNSVAGHAYEHPARLIGMVHTWRRMITGSRIRAGEGSAHRGDASAPTIY